MKTLLTLLSLFFLFTLSGCTDESVSVNEELKQESQNIKKSEDANYGFSLPDKISLKDGKLFKIPISCEIKNDTEKAAITGFSLEIKGLPTYIKKINENSIFLKGVEENSWSIGAKVTDDSSFVYGLGLNAVLRRSQTDFIEVLLFVDEGLNEEEIRESLSIELIVADADIPSQSHKFNLQVDLTAR